MVNDGNFLDRRQENQAGLLIPCSTTEFGSFLAGLLRTPRTIRRTFYQPIDVDVSAIVEILQLIDQRIGEQHESTRASQEVQILFEDGRSVELGSLDDFLSYNEPGSRKCVSVSVSSVYLIKLPHSDVPARNEITLEFKADSTSHIREDIFKNRVIGDIAPKQSGVGYVIRHKSVTLGNDLANLLDNKIKSMEITDKFNSFFSSGRVMLFTIVLGGLVGVAASVWINAKILSKVAFRGAAFSGANSAASTVVAQSVAFAVLFLAMLVGIFAAVLLIGELIKDRPSFIHLNEASKTRAKSSIDKFNRRWFKLAGSILIALVIGVVGSLTASAIWENT